MHRALGGPRPLVLAHRGGCTLGPENTLTAFERGFAAGADGFEIDVRLSRDGEIVVIHDETVDRTTNARGPVASMTAGELASVDAAYWFRPEDGYPLRGRGIGIPRLADALAGFPDAVFIVELKQDDTESARRAVDVVRAAQALDRVMIGSFHRRALGLVRRLEPGVPTGAATSETRLAMYLSRLRLPILRPRYRAFQVPEAYGPTRVVTPEFVRMAHAAGVPVQVWTVDDEQDMRRLLSWGVDGLITDRPGLAARVVRDGSRGSSGSSGAGAHAC
ncbi:MAG: glycerophosphodiester phosphodiesterase [Vicinamibacterales bacterium]